MRRTALARARRALQDRAHRPAKQDQPCAAVYDWRRARLTVANAIAPKAANFLPREEAGSVRATALEVAGQMNDAKVKDGLTALAKTLGAP
jgi:hypothetical protein